MSINLKKPRGTETSYCGQKSWEKRKKKQLLCPVATQVFRCQKKKGYIYQAAKLKK
jgi:hypothetical protein